MVKVMMTSAQVVEMAFKSALIIHKERRKEITIVMVVWVPDLS